MVRWLDARVRDSVPVLYKIDTASFCSLRTSFKPLRVWTVACWIATRPQCTQLANLWKASISAFCMLKLLVKWTTSMIGDTVVNNEQVERSHCDDQVSVSAWDLSTKRLGIWLKSVHFKRSDLWLDKNARWSEPGHMVYGLALLSDPQLSWKRVDNMS